MYSITSTGWVLFVFASTVAGALIIELLLSMRRNPIESGANTFAGTGWLLIRILLLCGTCFLLGASPIPQYLVTRYLGIPLHAVTEYAGTLDEVPDPTNYSWEEDTAKKGEWKLSIPDSKYSQVITFDAGVAQKVEVHTKKGTIPVPVGTTSIIVHHQDTAEHRSSKAVQIRKKT